MLYMSILNNHTTEIWLTSRILAFSPPSPPCCAACEGDFIPCFWSYYSCSALMNTWRKTDTHKVTTPLATEIMTEYQEIVTLIGVILRKLLVSQSFQKCPSFHFHRNVIRHSSQENVKTCFFSEVSFPIAHLCIAVLNLQVGMRLLLALQNNNTALSKQQTNLKRKAILVTDLDRTRGYQEV